MSIRFVKLLCSIVWQNRHNETGCMIAILKAFAVYGNPYAQSLIDYYDWDTMYENKVFYFDNTKIHMIWRKDIKSLS